MMYGTYGNIATNPQTQTQPHINNLNQPPIQPPPSNKAPNSSQPSLKNYSKKDLDFRDKLLKMCNNLINPEHSYCDIRKVGSGSTGSVFLCENKNFLEGEFNLKLVASYGHNEKYVAIKRMHIIKEIFLSEFGF